MAGRWLFDSSRKDAGRTCLGQPYTLIQNKVKRTLRGRPLRRGQGSVTRMSALGRFLPVATLISDRQLLGESSHSDFCGKALLRHNAKFRLWPILLKKSGFFQMTKLFPL